MPLEDILKRIRDDVKAQVEAIRKDSMAGRERILKEAGISADRKRQEIVEDAIREAELEAQRIISVASLDSRKIILSARQEIIDECFNRTLNELSSMDAESYEGLLKQMILNYIDPDIAEQVLIISEKDKNRIDPKRLVDDINQVLKRKGIKTRIHLSREPGDFSGGFLLKSGTFIKNLSWDILFRLKRPELELGISKILFE